ncbi:immunity protein Imm33 domain-containing protein [Aquihabitans sp. McL0605]|uniref:immunity protein Imm33 domain-containing protein n=1 Tax=Aquihabitans sp. McL0605 TaxID=3415671 RepID=UPI003CF7DCC2
MSDATPASTRPIVPAEWGLLDAEAQHEAFPDTFPIPTVGERQALRAGDMVKLVFVLDPPPASGPNAERMWVEVRSTLPDSAYEGWLTNRPKVITSLEPSAVVAFEARHVAGIALRKEDVTFDVKLRAVVSTRVREVPGPPGWAGFDTPLDATDSGWSITAGDEAEDFFGDGDGTGTEAMALGELVQRFPALVEVFQAGVGEWVYRPDHRRYVRLKNT